jgi:REP element-mobilizing transposase RayT
MTPPNHPTRKQLRLPQFDYSTPADYFITLVTYQRQHIFGAIHNAETTLTEPGTFIQQTWTSLPSRYPNILLGPYVIMPNHLHAVITFTDFPTTSPQDRRKMTLPLILGYFKMTTAKNINLLRSTPGTPLWQRNYYEHIIRNEHEYHNIESYILNNPANWLTDEENIEKILI